MLTDLESLQNFSVGGLDGFLCLILGVKLNETVAPVNGYTQHLPVRLKHLHNVLS